MSDERFDVDTRTCVLAIQAGMGHRLDPTANDDAAALARRVWHALDDDQRETIRHDADYFTGPPHRAAWLWLVGPDEPPFRGGRS